MKSNNEHQKSSSAGEQSVKTALNRWVFTCFLVSSLCTVASAQNDGTMEIQLGETIPATWDSVKAAGYEYAPKQEFDAGSMETRIWLPYGPGGTYFEKSGVNLTQAGPDGTGTPLAVSTDGNTAGSLVYKLHFDKPISAIRFKAGFSEWGVGGDTVGGVEFSTDGETWTTIREVNKPGIVEPFSDGTKIFPVAKAQDLFIRLYTRTKEGAVSGSSYFMKFRLAGDPAWGDAPQTFAAAQLQLWAVAAE